MNLVIFISGGGTTLNAIAEAIESGRLKSKIVLAVSNKSDASGLENYVKPRGIPIEIIPRKKFENEEEFGLAIIDVLEKYEADFICLAGFLQKIPANVVAKYKGRIINSHPGDTKKYGGEGMYGKFVHEAVIANGEKETMSTVHWVDEVYDRGGIISQIKMEIPESVTPEELAKRLLPIEWENYVQALEKIGRQTA